MKSVPWLFLLTAAACGPDSEQRPMLLLDSSARSAGYALSVGGWTGSPLTPISVTVLDDVSLIGPGGTRHLVPQPGALGHITGAGAQVTWSVLGKEVDTDHFTVRGTESAAQHLATLLDAHSKSAGSDRWLVSGTDVLAQVAWLEPPAGADEIVPELLSAAMPARPPAATFQLATAPSGLPSSSVRLIDDVPSLVGVYVAGAEQLVLDASGGFRLQVGCDDTPGHFFVAGGTVILIPDTGPRRELGIQSTGALTDHFSRFEEATAP